MKCNFYTNFLLRRKLIHWLKTNHLFDYFNKRLMFPFVLRESINFLDRNQSDSRRSKLKSCKKI